MHLTDKDGQNTNDAIMKSPWLYMQSEQADCQSIKCPIPLQWTAWTCTCDGIGAPKCCGKQQYRFRGCENQNQCRNGVTCAAMAQAVTSSDPRYSYVQNCADYVGGTGPNICAERFYSNDSWWINDNSKNHKW